MQVVIDEDVLNNVMAVAAAEVERQIFERPNSITARQIREPFDRLIAVLSSSTAPGADAGVASRSAPPARR